MFSQKCSTPIPQDRLAVPVPVLRPVFLFQLSATRLFLVDASPLSMPFAILIQSRILMSFV